MSGRPASFSMAQSNENPHGYIGALKRLAEANEGGPRVRAQVYPRPIGVVLGFDLTINPFSLCPSWPALAALPFERRIAALRDPQVRARLLMEEPGDALIPLARLGRRFDFMYPLGDPPNYEPAPETSIAAQAARRGVSPTELAYDLMLENGGRTMLLAALANYGSRSLDPIHALITDPNSVIGLGDGGAHYGMICDSSYPTFVLQHWTRERKGARLSIEAAVKALTSDQAETVGLRDRGVLSVGRKADANVIDYGALRLDAPTILHDLPAGGRRLTQTARGYDALIVSGQVVAREGQPTGALPGRLVRGQQAAPA
jgi:N-acyl-D-aspartate/D-glutamate deacylase